MIVEEGVPLDRQIDRQHDVSLLLYNDVQVGPSRRRRSGRKGQGAGLGIAEDESGEGEVKEDEDDDGGDRVTTIA